MERRTQMSWEQLQAILKENKTTRAIEERDPPVACPFDGAILDTPQGEKELPDGKLYLDRWKQSITD